MKYFYRLWLVILFFGGWVIGAQAAPFETITHGDLVIKRQLKDSVVVLKPGDILSPLKNGRLVISSAVPIRRGQVVVYNDQARYVTALSQDSNHNYVLALGGRPASKEVFDSFQVTGHLDDNDWELEESEAKAALLGSPTISCRKPKSAFSYPLDAKESHTTPNIPIKGYSCVIKMSGKNITASLTLGIKDSTISYTEDSSSDRSLSFGTTLFASSEIDLSDSLNWDKELGSYKQVIPQSFGTLQITVPISAVVEANSKLSLQTTYNFPVQLTAQYYPSLHVTGSVNGDSTLVPKIKNEADIDVDVFAGLKLGVYVGDKLTDNHLVYGGGYVRAGADLTGRASMTTDSNGAQVSCFDPNVVLQGFLGAELLQPKVVANSWQTGDLLHKAITLDPSLYTSCITFDLSVTPTSGEAPLTVLIDATCQACTGFTLDQSSGFDAANEVGATSGTGSSWKSPLTLTKAGTYTVKVTAQGEGGATVTKQQTVTVTYPNEEGTTCNGRLVLHGSTFTDTKTGLVWDRCIQGHTFVDAHTVTNSDGTTTEVPPACQGDATSYNWDDAMAKFGSSLPTKEQADAIVYDCNYDSMGSKDFYDTMPDGDDGSWTASLEAYYGSYGVWVVLFDRGFNHNSSRYYYGDVRLVRSGQ